MLAMTHSRWCWGILGSLLGVGGAIALSGNYAIAQIVPDRTLGAESSIECFAPKASWDLWVKHRPFIRGLGGI